MKRICFFCIAILILFALVSCTSQSAETAGSETNSPTVQVTDPTGATTTQAGPQTPGGNETTEASQTSATQETTAPENTTVLPENDPNWSPNV